MHLSAKGMSLLMRSEGFRRRVYRDVAGLQTIGYGHRVLAGEAFAEGITDQQAEALLDADVTLAEEAVKRLVRVPLTQGQFDALVDFTFNLGSGRLAASTLLRELNAGHYAQACRELLRWDHCGKEELAGLRLRRQAEQALWNLGAPALPAAQPAADPTSAKASA